MGTAHGIPDEEEAKKWDTPNVLCCLVLFVFSCC